MPFRCIRSSKKKKALNNVGTSLFRSERRATNSLLDNEDTVHSSTTVRFTVVLVSTSGGELHGEGVTFFTKLLFHGDSLLRDSRGDSVLVEDNVVRTTLVVSPKIDRLIDIKIWLECKISVQDFRSLSSFHVPFDRISGADGGLGRDENKLS